jgi:hypothetical protein
MEEVPQGKVQERTRRRPRLSVEELTHMREQLDKEVAEINRERMRRRFECESSSSSSSETESSEEMEGEPYLEDYSHKELFKMLQRLDCRFHGCITDFKLAPQRISNLLATDKGVKGKFEEAAQVTRGDPVMLVALATLESSIHHMIRAMGQLASRPHLAAEHLMSALPLLMHGASRLHARVIMDAQGMSTEQRHREALKDRVPRELREVIDTAFFRPEAGAATVPGTTIIASTPAPPATPILVAPTPRLAAPAPSPTDTPGVGTAWTHAIDASGTQTFRGQVLGLPAPEIDGFRQRPGSSRGRRRPQLQGLLPPPERPKGRIFPFDMDWHEPVWAIKKREQQQRQREQEARRRGKRKQIYVRR